MKRPRRDDNVGLIRWASHRFPIEKAGRQDFMTMIASINKYIVIGIAMRGTRYEPFKKNGLKLKSSIIVYL